MKTLKEKLALRRERDAEETTRALSKEMTRLFGPAYIASYKAGASPRDELIEKLAEALDFYSKGGNFNTDIWVHPDLGYFTGKRAKKILAELDRFVAGEEKE